jgi:ABC-type branched-subunit amino acid transport system substrate-binding protein
MTNAANRVQPRQVRRRRLAAALLSLVGVTAVVTGCGTTVPLTQQRDLSTPDGSAEVPSGTDNGIPPTSTDGATANAVPGTSGQGGTSGRPSGSGPAAISTQQPGAPLTAGPRQAPGVASRSINIGFEVSDADEAFKALGFGNLTTGNTKNQVKALVDYINAQGGLAGRKIEPILYQVPTANTGNNAQTECAHFTQDHKVFAVIGAGAGSSVALITCLAKANTIYIDGYGSLNEATARTLRGYWYDPADFVLDRFARLYVDQLVALGFFTKQAKIGLLTYDDPRFRDVVTRVLKPALAAHGLEVADEALYSTSGYASQSPAFVLKFQTEGITHVLNLVAGVVVFFQQAAENQRYRPRYALSSRDGPGSFVQVLAPPAQLLSSLGIGWQPFADVDLAHSPGDVSPNQALCRQIMKRAGEDVTNGGVLVVTGRYCETSFFLRTALGRAESVTPAGLNRAVSQLGSAYLPVTTFKTYFASQRPDGPAQIRPFAFSGDCTCFQYSGGKRDLPH